VRNASQFRLDLILRLRVQTLEVVFSLVELDASKVVCQGIGDFSIVVVCTQTLGWFRPPAERDDVIHAFGKANLADIPYSNAAIARQQ